MTSQPMTAPRKLGDQRAKALMLTPLWLDGRAMVDWDMALSSAPCSELDAEVENVVSLLRVRSRPAKCFRAFVEKRDPVWGDVDARPIL